MKAFNPYLNFDGNTREAMEFYHRSLGGDLSMQTFKDAHMDKPGMEDRILHARLAIGNNPATVIMASDNQPAEGSPVSTGVWISVDCSDPDEQARLFNGIGDGGKVMMDLQDTFWGARFGMLRDKYGIGWMFNCELPKKS